MNKKLTGDSTVIANDVTAGRSVKCLVRCGRLAAEIAVEE
jgi:hypothetical protein